jgi:uncharacterized protein (TIGR02444 family)
MRGKSSAFWRFSLRAYGRPGVAEACLALQEGCGADVNLLLFCCWLGRHGHAPGRSALRSVMRRVRPWQENVVRQLRRARRAIPKDDPALQRLRKRVAALEIEAERAEQAMLEGLGSGLRVARPRLGPARAAAANLETYLELLGVRSLRARSALVKTLAEAGSA